MFKNDSVSEKKIFPKTINDDKQNIILENIDSRFHISDKYKNLYIIPKNEFNSIKADLEAIPADPILKNESGEILDFDTYTIDSQKGVEVLKNIISKEKKKYVRDNPLDNTFVNKPITVAILNSIMHTAVLSPYENTAVLNPYQNVAILSMAKIGGKKSRKTRKTRKTRKHRGIIQTGGNTGRLRKGYKYSGKKLKNGMPEILKVKSIKK